MREREGQQMSRWFLELVQDHDGSYYANMAIEGTMVHGLPEHVDYNTLREAIRAKTGIEILKRKDMKFQQSGRKKYAYIDATQYRQDCRVMLKEIKDGWRPNFKKEYKVYHQNEKEITAFYNAIQYWSNALGELHCHGEYDITEDELPSELRHAYEDLFFEGNIGSLRYLVETDKGFGIALINEYDTCYAGDCGLSMEELFQTAMKDAENIAQDPAFEKADIYLAEFMGFDSSHELAVVLPADISTQEFMAVAAKLDTMVYQSAKNMQRPSLEGRIQAAQDMSEDGLGQRVSALESSKGYHNNSAIDFNSTDNFGETDIVNCVNSTGRSAVEDKFLSDEYYGYECGVLLTREDNEYEQYSCNNPSLSYGFYDEDQGFCRKNALGDIRQRMRKYVEEGVDMTYAVISFQGPYKQHGGKKMEEGGEVNGWMDYTFFKNKEAIEYSVCKIGGEIIEGFLEELIERDAGKENQTEQWNSLDNRIQSATMQSNGLSAKVVPTRKQELSHE